MSRNRIVHQKVLEKYRDLSFLWDRNHVDYKNKHKREAGYKIILNIYKELDETATVKTVAKKISNFRSNYQKELVKVKASNHTGEKYEPTIWYFDLLNFLDGNCKSGFEIEAENSTDPFSECDLEKEGRIPKSPPIKQRDTESFSDCDSEKAVIIINAQSPPKMRRVTESLSDHDFEEEVKIKTTKTPPRKKRAVESFFDYGSERDQSPISPPRKRRYTDLSLNTQEPRSNSIGKSYQLEESEWEIIGKGIGIQFRNLNKRQFFIAQKLIHDTLFYAQIGVLTEQSSVTGLKIHKCDNNDML